MTKRQLLIKFTYRFDRCKFTNRSLHLYLVNHRIKPRSNGGSIASQTRLTYRRAKIRIFLRRRGEIFRASKSEFFHASKSEFWFHALEMSLGTHAEGKRRDLDACMKENLGCRASERTSVIVSLLQALNLIGYQAQAEINMPSRSFLQGRVLRVISLHAYV